MPLASDNDGISWLCRLDCMANGCSTVRIDDDNLIFGHSSKNIADNGIGGFRSWIVTGDDADICLVCDYLSHDRSFCPVTVAPASKNNDDAPQCDVANSVNDIA